MKSSTQGPHYPKINPIILVFWKRAPPRDRFFLYPYFNPNFLFSFLFVNSWVEDIEKAQCTDVHYRSMNGEGNFNWRMLFPIKFSLTEDMVMNACTHPLTLLKFLNNTF